MNYTIEERDDERTLTGELVPDCEKAVEKSLPILEYLGEFKALIDACGQVSYFMNMKKFVAADVNKAKIIAAAYQHDLRYYEDQYNEWRVKAKRSFDVLSVLAPKFGYEMPRKSDFLNGMTFSIDRREAYKDYLKTCFRNNKTLSPENLEEKFQKRLEKRKKKANK